ncbi:MAG: helix-turn-helix domain-containing protein [Clostridia bacterium]|nr:helix-turn-helix domain-containing protein [Clostridia bacterium]
MVSFELISPSMRSLFVTPVYQYQKDVIHRKLSLSYRFLMPVSGSFTLRWDDHEEMCAPGDVVYMVPGQRYDTVFHPGRSEFMNVFFEFYPSMPTEQTMRKKQSINNFFLMGDFEISQPPKCADKILFDDQPDFNETFVLHNMPDAEEKFRQLCRLYRGNDPYACLRLNARLADLIADVAAYHGMTHRSPGRANVRAIVSYINTHFTEPLTCRQIAEKFSYHPNYVNRIVRELTGMSLHEYIVCVKIQHANQLLLETNMSITEIAYSLSFHDSSHFSSVYQTHTGMKPSERRKMIDVTEKK